MKLTHITTRKLRPAADYEIGSYTKSGSARWGVYNDGIIIGVVENVTGYAGFWTVSTPNGKTLHSGISSKGAAVDSLITRK